LFFFSSVLLFFFSSILLYYFSFLQPSRDRQPLRGGVRQLQYCFWTIYALLFITIQRRATPHAPCRVLCDRDHIHLWVLLGVLNCDPMLCPIPSRFSPLGSTAAPVKTEHEVLHMASFGTIFHAFP